MNFRIIFHLFATDWQRLKRFVIGLWILMFLTAMPWWFNDPLGFTLPAYWNSGGSGNWIDAQHERLYSNPWIKEPLIWSNLVRMVMALAIAMSIGMAGYFGSNDFFPFNRGELKTTEPTIDRLLTEIWGSNPR